jgi:hypothetical protein
MSCCGIRSVAVVVEINWPLITVAGEAVSVTRICLGID